MEPGSLLPHSQKPATCAHPEPHQFRPCPNLAFRLSILILSWNLRLGLPSGRFHSDFPLHFNQTRNINSFCVPYQKHIILVLRLCHNRLVSGRNYTLLRHNTEQDLHHFFKKTKILTSVSLRWSSQESRHNKPNSRPSRKLSIFVLGLSRIRNVCLWRLLWRYK